MIATSRSSYDVLKRLHKYENELINLPDHFRMMVQERLDSLAHLSRTAPLKFVGQAESRQRDP